MSKELAEAVKSFISQPLKNPLTRGQVMEVARIALPILEQQERGEDCGESLKHERDDDWIRWDGVIDACAEPVDGFIHVKFRDGIESKDYAHRYFWNHDGSSSDIIAYRIIPEQPTNQNGEQ